MNVLYSFLPFRIYAVCAVLQVVVSHSYACLLLISNIDIVYVLYTIKLEPLYHVGIHCYYLVLVCYVSALYCCICYLYLINVKKTFSLKQSVTAAKVVALFYFCFSSPQRLRVEPGRQTVFGEFQAKNLSHSSNDLQELFRKCCKGSFLFQVHQIRFWLGRRPRLRWGARSHSCEERGRGC